MLIGVRRARSVAEGSLQQLEMAYNTLEDSEREKRAAGILKVENTFANVDSNQSCFCVSLCVELRPKDKRSTLNLCSRRDAAMMRSA